MSYNSSSYATIFNEGFKLKNIEYITNKRIFIIIFDNGISATLLLDEVKIQLFDRYQRLCPVIIEDKIMYDRLKKYIKENIYLVKKGNRYIGE